MTGELWPSAFVAAVFAIHPLRVESVAWVAERKDVLSGLFFMLTLAAYLGYVRHPFSLLRYLAVVLLFALGLMAKPMLVTLPFVLLLLDYWPLGRLAGTAFSRAARRSRGRRKGNCPLSLPRSGSATAAPTNTPGGWSEKLPLLALSAASCVATFWPSAKPLPPTSFPWPWRIGNAVVSYIAYLGQLFCPAGLAVLYPHAGSHLSAWKVVGALSGAGGDFRSRVASAAAFRRCLSAGCGTWGCCCP